MRKRVLVGLLVLSSLPLAGQAAAPAAQAATLLLSLDRAESLALANSDALRIQELRALSSANRLTLSIRDYLPQLELGFSSADTVAVAAQDSSSRQLTLTVRQPIYNGGRSETQRSLARLQLILSRHATDVAREDVLNDVWDKFHELLVLQSQRAVKAEALTQSRAQQEIARTEHDLGMIREVDLLDVELSVSSQEIDLQSTDAEMVDALYALKKSVGLDLGQDLALDGSIDASYQGIAIGRPTEDFVAMAQDNNLDLQSAEYRVTQLETQLAMARSQFLPQISADLSFSLSGNGFPLQTPAFTVGVDVSFPEAVAPVKASASGGATGPSSSSRNTSLAVDPLQSITAGLDETDASLQLEEARAALRALTRDLHFRVGQLISLYRQHATRIELERQARGLMQRKLAILAQQVASGSATRMDYLKQQTDAANQEVQLLSDILTLFRDERSIERLLGVEPGDLVRLAGGGNG